MQNDNKALKHDEIVIFKGMKSVNRLASRQSIPDFSQILFIVYYAIVSQDVCVQVYYGGQEKRTSVACLQPLRYTANASQGSLVLQGHPSVQTGHLPHTMLPMKRSVGAARGERRITALTCMADGKQKLESSSFAWTSINIFQTFVSYNVAHEKVSGGSQRRKKNYSVDMYV